MRTDRWAYLPTAPMGKYAGASVKMVLKRRGSMGDKDLSDSLQFLSG